MGFINHLLVRCASRFLGSRDMKPPKHFDGEETTLNYGSTKHRSNAAAAPNQSHLARSDKVLEKT